MSLLGILWAIIAAYLILRAVRQLKSYPILRPEPIMDADTLPSVTVIVPARNEADVITRCLSGLKEQNYPSDLLKITVVDDGSSDGTAALAAAAAASDPRIRVTAAGPLPSGWTGKSHACWIAARATEAEWLCFTDADTAAHPLLLRSALKRAQREKFDFLSLEPRQELETAWERLVMPAGFFALAFTRDLRLVNDPTSPQASANGQFILLRRSVYQQVGGHAAVRAAIDEDSRLAQAVKAAGYRVAVLSGKYLIRARMYRNLRSLWQGLSRNSTEALGGAGPVLLICALGLPLAWAALALPLLLLAHLTASPTGPQLLALGLATGASLAVVGIHVAGARYLAIPAWYGLLFPIGYSLGAALALYGLLALWQGHILWKGRSYPLRSTATPSPPHRRSSN